MKEDLFVLKFVSFSLDKQIQELTPATSKICLIDSEISGPIPSPGIRVQVCFDLAVIVLPTVAKNLELNIINLKK